MASLMSVAFVSAAESTVTLEKTHICCAKCVKAVEKVVAGVPNAKVVIDQPTGKVTLTVPNEETGQKAIDALVAAGFYGKATGATVKADSGAPAGTVKTLTITTHNCCKKCAAALNGIIKTVPGATGTAEHHHRG
jgi:copper chaperone CopZ